MDCSCTKDPTKCEGNLHICLCQQHTSYWDRNLDGYREYVPPRGFGYCKADYHHCRCHEDSGTYECRRQQEHACVCLIRGNHGQKRCIATVHSCSCKMWGPETCMDHDPAHPCVCKDGKGLSCKAIKHECSCSKIDKSMTCRANPEDHSCSCALSPKNCLAIVHSCQCLSGSKSRLDGCKSLTHPCYCSSSNSCVNAPHTCICTKNPSRCRHLEKHVCVCNKFVGHCNLHKGKIY